MKIAMQAAERHILNVIVDNEPGILAKITGMFTARGYNIDSLTVADISEDHAISRITIVTNGPEPVIDQIRAQLEETSSEYDKEKLQERLAKLAGGVAVIKVGGATEVEVKERKDRVDDALNATRAAVEEGIVPGGGTALLAAASNIDVKGLNADEQAGIDIVRKALEAPVRQIAENAGVEGSVVVDQIRRGKGKGFGFNAQTEEYGDLVAMGVIDPVKVVRSALQNAASVAGLLITTEASIAEAPKKEGAGGGMPDMGGGMGGMGGMGF